MRLKNEDIFKNFYKSFAKFKKKLITCMELICMKLVTFSLIIKN